MESVQLADNQDRAAQSADACNWLPIRMDRLLTRTVHISVAISMFVLSFV